MRVKSAMMVAPGNFTVTSDSGHTIRFEANKPTFVPGIMVRLCRQYGCVEKQRFKDTEQEYPSYAANVTGGLHAVPNTPDMEAIEEVTVASLQEEQEAEPESERYTAKENRIRGVINSLVSTGDERAFTDEGVPKVGVINKGLQDFTISADTRNEVWAKMNRFGEIPDDWYAEDEDG